MFTTDPPPLSLSQYKYIRVSFDVISREIVEQQHLGAIVNNGWVYMRIRKEIPGLKQADKVVNKRLTTHLAKYGYSLVPCTRQYGITLREMSRSHLYGII